ncbi:tyrosine-type recombinase/integrase [Alicyclobacillus fructus]|uniref:tyrosine-type recombinase/integrase n=1 Tax=Alicyclobacillus fructus TaxID=2816082 RepID=UPI001A8C8696|nr:tyrosine-type recombinase/integrase [Alicyclobacillus fructus]
MDITWQMALKEFMFTKEAEGTAPSTLRGYRYHITSFFDEHGEKWPDIPKLKRAVVAHFASLRASSPAHYNLRRAYLKAFCAWCVQEGYLDQNPVQIPKRKDEGASRNIDAETLERLLALPNQQTYAGRRDYALMLLQLDTGIRPGEALQLTPADIRWDALEIHVPSTVAKTRTSRVVVMSPQTSKALRRLMALRPDDWGDDVPLFASANGRPLPSNEWSHKLAEYSRKLGVKVTPYMLRHTSAIMFLRGGGNVFALQRQLGHSSLVMTKRYVHLADEDLHKQHAIASPVAQLLPSRTRARRAQ